VNSWDSHTVDRSMLADKKLCSLPLSSITAVTAVVEVVRGVVHVFWQVGVCHIL
jgi:hypothetical protein